MNLGSWPTPIAEVVVHGEPLWVKREGASHPVYGGNKIRTLEAWLAHAADRGARRIWGIGAYGSNHVIAMVKHARTAGLDAGAILFPQPDSVWATENEEAIDASGCEVIKLRSVIEMPFAAAIVAARGVREIVMPPGGATPIGTFGALTAALELAEQVTAGAMPAPSRIVIPIGSTCTTAGLLVGLGVARAIGMWPSREALPVVHGVRVTPWPVTSRATILALAIRTMQRLVSLGGPKSARLGELVVDGSQLGPGYGTITSRGERARVAFEAVGAPRVDGVYGAKAAASLLALHRAGEQKLLFWATKSEALLTACA